MAVSSRLSLVLIEVSIIRDPIRTTRPPIKDESTRIESDSLSLPASRATVFSTDAFRLSSSGTAEMTSAATWPRRRACSSKKARITGISALKRPFAAIVPTNLTVLTFGVIYQGNVNESAGDVFALVADRSAEISRALSNYDIKSLKTISLKLDKTFERRTENQVVGKIPNQGATIFKGFY